MTHVLCIETSTTNCSVAIATEVGSFKNNLNISCCLDLIEDQSNDYSHGERLHVFIKKILEKNNLSTTDLDAIAISTGPGSYTGLRIGIATAKGLCYALNIPLIAIDTLTALSLQDTSNGSYTIACIDARRMEVYSAVLKNSAVIQQPEATILTSESFAGYLKMTGSTVLGTGVLKFQEITDYKFNNAFTTVNPTALTMCDLAISKIQIGDTVSDIAYFEPFYLKEFRV